MTEQPTAHCPGCYRLVPITRDRLTAHRRPNSMQQCPGTGRPVAPPPPPRDTSKDMLTVREVAALARVSQMTIYRLVHAEELRALRVGRSFRIRRGDVDQFLADAEVGK